MAYLELRVHQMSNGEHRILVGTTFKWKRIVEGPKGWWQEYPLLATYIAATGDESSAVAVVPEELKATSEEAKTAEEQLGMYGARLVYDMGYYGLSPHDTLYEGLEFLPYTIAGRYF